MKRTKHIDLSRMRKSAKAAFAINPLTVGIAFALTGCAPQEEVKVVQSVDECVTDTEMDRAACEAVYQQAQAEAERTAPRYDSRSDCSVEFGECQQHSSGAWMPFMTGFMISSALNNVGDSMERRHNPVFQYKRSGSSNLNKIMTADGAIVGRPGRSSYQVSQSATQPKPAPTTTLSRGGFGSTASAKASWGGGKSSGSWGG